MAASVTKTTPATTAAKITSPTSPTDTPTYVCVDYSGSTGGHAGYWDGVKRIVDGLDGAQLKCILWDTAASPVTRMYLEDNISKRKGNGGTDPSCLVPVIPADSHVVLITDGQIDAGTVAGCDRQLASRPFASVTVHFLNSGGQMNLSVSTPFTRATQYQLFVDHEPLATGSSTQPLDLSGYRDQPDKFVREAESLRQQVIMQTLGRTNVALRDQLLDLKKNLLAALARQAAADGTAALRQLQSTLAGSSVTTTSTSTTTSAYDSAVAQLQTIVAAVDSSAGKIIDNTIMDLAKVCEGQGGFSFELLQPGRLRRAADVAATVAEELPPNQEYAGGYECPVSLDVDMPCLLIKDGPPVLEGQDKSYVDTLMSSPLLLLNNPQLVEKMRARLDAVLGVAAVRTLFTASNTPPSPLTRAPLAAAVCLGQHSSHDKATNYALSRLLFGRKLVGVPELWLAVVYFVVKATPFLASQTDFMTALEANLKQRCHHSTTALTLTGLPVAPLLKVPTDVAVWYCVISPLLLSAQDEATDMNRLRSFGSAGIHLVNLLNLLGYPYPKTDVLKLLSWYKAFSWMMAQDKNLPGDAATTYGSGPLGWRNALRCQYQKSVRVGTGVFVPLDGAASPSQVLPPLPNFTVTDSSGAEYTPALSELLALATKVDRTKTLGVVPLPPTLSPLEPVISRNYGYPADMVLPAAGEITVPVSTVTCRPYVLDLISRRHWREQSILKYGPIEDQLSTYNYFLRYVCEHVAYPSADELIEYMAEKQRQRQDVGFNDRSRAKDTLPEYVVECVQELLLAYATIMTTLTPLECKQRSEAARAEEQRARLDGSSA